MQRPFQQSVFCVLFPPAEPRPLPFLRSASDGLRRFLSPVSAVSAPGLRCIYASPSGSSLSLRFQPFPPVPAFSSGSSLFLRVPLLPPDSASSAGSFLPGQPPPGSQARSRSEPPALRSRSSSRSARLSRIVSRMVQRLSNSCASMRGCSSLTTRMMSFIAT